MSSYYIEAIVHQTIPCECVKLVEAWLLTRLFKTKIRHVKNKIKHDRFCFSAGWMLDDLDQGAFSSDGKLTKALAASRKVCPELCAEVEHEIDSGGNIRLGMIDHKKIFQSIVRRHTNRLPHVSILEFLHGTDRVQYLEEAFTLITAGAIEALKTRGLTAGRIRRSGLRSRGETLPRVPGCEYGILNHACGEYPKFDEARSS